MVAEDERTPQIGREAIKGKNCDDYDESVDYSRTIS
jgi:hypothetical protein